MNSRTLHVGHGPFSAGVRNAPTLQRRCSARGAQHGSATVGERWPFACSASMNSVALKAPSGVLLHPPTQGPRGILEPRSAGARTHALGGVLIAAARARVTP